MGSTISRSPVSRKRWAGRSYGASGGPQGRDREFWAQARKLITTEDNPILLVLTPSQARRPWRPAALAYNWIVASAATGVARRLARILQRI